MADVTQVLQFLLNGVAFGAILVLAAIGLTLVYGILDLPNFAHGELLAMGAYGLFFFSVLLAFDATVAGALAVAAVLAAAGVAGRRLRRGGRPALEAAEARAVLGAAALLALLAAGVARPPLAAVEAALVPAGVAVLLASGAAWRLGALERPVLRRPAAALAALAAAGLAWSLASPWLLATALAAGVTGLVAIGVELAVWRPLRRRQATVLTLLIVSIGVALVLRSALALRFGSDFLNFQRPLQLPHRFAGLTLTADQATTILLAAALVVAVHLFLRHTRTGKALRALADDRDLARLSGVDVDRMVLVVWALAGGLAAVAGALLPLNNFAVSPGVGFLLLLVVFASVILGGLGSPYGAMAGGLLIGVAMELTAGLWRAEYKFAVGFVVMIAALLVRPQGLLGGRVA